MSKFLVLAGLLAVVTADLPLEVSEYTIRNTAAEVDPTIYRLPEDLDPIHFEVDVTPYFEDAPLGKTNFTFDGIVTIKLKVCTKLNYLLISFDIQLYHGMIEQCYETVAWFFGLWKVKVDNNVVIMNSHLEL